MKSASGSGSSERKWPSLKNDVNAVIVFPGALTCISGEGKTTLKRVNSQKGSA